MARSSGQALGPEVLEKLRDQLQAEFPELHLLQRDNITIVAGVFPLVDTGEVVDRYQIELDLPSTYPSGLPVLREVGGRIPRIADRHVEQDGKACLFLPDEYLYRHPDGMELLDFLKGPVLGFLVGQSLAERGQPWRPQDERAHGNKGTAGFYGELLGSSDPATIIRYLEALAAKKVKGHWPCPCGTGKQLRDCHQARILNLRDRIPRSIAKESLKRLKNSPPQP